MIGGYTSVPGYKKLTIDTPKTEKESMWAVSGTGEDFQCVHIDEAREMERLLVCAKNVLTKYANNDMMGLGGDDLVSEITKYLES